MPSFDIIAVMQRSNRTSAYRGKAPADPWIFTKKTVWMQRLSDNVKASATYVIQGSTRLEKVPGLVQKFSARYPTNLNSRADLATRKRRKTAQRWIGYLDDNSGMVNWCLFVWPGEDFATSSDTWIDLKQNRIRHSGYELVRMTKRGAKAPVLTWRYQRQQFEHLHDQIVQVIRQRQDALLDQIIHSLHRSPGFAGVRAQVKKLWQIVRAEWKRTRSKSEPVPEIPPNIGYVRRLPDVGALWSELMQSHKPKGAQDGNTVETPRRKARNPALLVQPATRRKIEKT